MHNHIDEGILWGGLTPAHRGQGPAAGRPGHTTYKVGDVAS